MGLLTGSLSFRRYRVLGTLASDFRDTFLDAITRHAFVENDRARTRDENIGWVVVTDPADGVFTPDKCWFNDFLALSVRIDRKRVPVKYLKIKTEKRVRDEMEAKGMPRISTAHRRELKEAVEEELLGRALPVVATYDLVWNLKTMDVLLFATSDLVCDLAGALFRETFKLDMTMVRLSDGLLPEFSREALEQAAGSLSPEQGWFGG